MLKKVLRSLTSFSIPNSVIRVDKLFIKRSSKSKIFRLENNFVFQHACMTPLTILSCALDTMDMHSDEERKSALLVAREATSRITQLIQSVTQQVSGIQFFFVSDAIQEVLLLFRRKHDCNVNYSSYLEKDTKLFGNRLYFQEMLICLLSNAAEAYPEKKSILITVLVKQVENRVTIDIVDFASGMSLLAQKIALIEGVSYKENGLGLGLFFTKNTIESVFQGEMKIQSRLGMGTHIKVILPIQVPVPCSQSLSQF